MIGIIKGAIDCFKTAYSLNEYFVGLRSILSTIEKTIEAIRIIKADLEPLSEDSRVFDTLQKIRLLELVLTQVIVSIRKILGTQGGSRFEEQTEEAA